MDSDDRAGQQPELDVREAAFAQQLGYTEAATLLQQTLNEEKAADAKLTQIGETAINPQASTERRAA